jgi:hypothetical protein
MSKYLVLYHSEGALNGPSVSEMFSNPPEQLAAGMVASPAREVRQRDHRPWRSVGQVHHSDRGALGSPDKTTITGYTFLQAGSLEEAVNLIGGHPHFRAPGAFVQILKCITMPGLQKAAPGRLTTN